MLMTAKRQLTENRLIKVISSKLQRNTKCKKYKWSLRDLRINNKRSNFLFLEVPEGEEKEHGS